MPDLVITDSTTPVKLEPGKPAVSTVAKVLVAPMPPGTYTFQLEITDSLGASDKKSVQVRVVAAGAPGPEAPRASSGKRKTASAAKPSDVSGRSETTSQGEAGVESVPQRTPKRRRKS